MKDLEEYSLVQLEDELKRRRELLAEGVCPYCGNRGTDPPCKETGQHEHAKKIMQPCPYCDDHIPKCGAAYKGFICTRRQQHDGPHIAWWT